MGYSSAQTWMRMSTREMVVAAVHCCRTAQKPRLVVRAPRRRAIQSLRGRVRVFAASRAQAPLPVATLAFAGAVALALAIANRRSVSNQN